MNKGSMYRMVVLVLAAALLVPLWGASSAWAESAEKGETPRSVSKKRLKKHAAPAAPAATTPTLYERLGGINTIAPLVADIIDRSYVSEVFKANPRIEEAHKRFSKAVYNYNATGLVCMVTGGPQKYTGRSIKEAHKNLQATEEEWQELIRMFRDSMNSFKVPPQEQSEVLAIVEASKGDVVVGAAKPAAN